MHVIGRILTGIVLTLSAREAASADPAPTATSAMNVTPLRLEFTRSQLDNQLLIRNESTLRLGLTVRLFAWTQDASGDHYALSNNYTVSPSIVQIEPGLTQTFRVIASAPPIGGREAAYRVVIDQLPQAVQPLQGAAQTRLRLTLPLFAGGETVSPGMLQFSVAGSKLLIRNIGGRSVKLSGVALRQGETAVPFEQDKAPTYVLGGASLALDLPGGLTCAGLPIRVIGQVDRKAFDAAASQTCT